MRAADDFAAIRARMQQLEREREWATHDREQRVRDEELDRLDFRAVQEIKDALKARTIARNRLG
jgi:hypothetical protein